MVALIQRLVTAAVLSLSALGVTQTPMTTNENVTDSTVESVVTDQVVTTSTTPQTGHVTTQSEIRKIRAEVEFNRQMRNKKIPNPAYWDRVARCETNSNWRDKGKFAGGLGIFIGTWQSFGGLEFAKSPQFATKTQQIVVANRIAVTGYQTKNKFMSLDDKQKNKPHFQYPVGYNGWGCIKNVVGKPQKKDFIKHKKKTK